MPTRLYPISILMHFRPCTQMLRNLAFSSHCRALVNDAFPLILAFELGDEEYPVLKEWVYKVAEILMELLQQTQEAEGHPSTGFRESNVRFMKPVNIQRTGKRGRPRKVPDENLLEEALHLTEI
ncbi:uncharacterized protein C8R40DRAFT_1075449 [Lentinula edodes]|uniref:uncharacterized protein n=1 Tax=Lentinula edodes TaxID=5353 RepID=UPI001E8EC201|nr:uncharacterized protein C8R40DRAFT_1075449 [Lentinula edodes]KAH7867642.1 hypothetical protein C8R40DRAFT_1075449 [Lentinula edodes]